MFDLFVDIFCCDTELEYILQIKKPQHFKNFVFIADLSNGEERPMVKENKNLITGMLGDSAKKGKYWIGKKSAFVRFI